jgi:hypothetical protein
MFKLMNDWFKNLTGFEEKDFQTTKQHLKVQDKCLISKVNQMRYYVGDFEVVALDQLRRRVDNSTIPSVTIPSSVKVVYGNAKSLHQAKENNGTLFQVASQFNMLEMLNPHVTKYDGVTGYMFDNTQGPACAMSCGAATIYRNYFQDDIDGLRDVKLYLNRCVDLTESFWNMKNGYALCTDQGLKKIEQHVYDDNFKDEIRKRIKYGIHWDTLVTDTENRVSQIFCSALPISYGTKSKHWEAFARIVLEAAYEATLLTAKLNSKSNIVYLTYLGGGVFGNDIEWIKDAIAYAVNKTKHLGLDIRIVEYKR